MGLSTQVGGSEGRQQSGSKCGAAEERAFAAPGEGSMACIWGARLPACPPIEAGLDLRGAASGWRSGASQLDYSCRERSPSWSRECSIVASYVDRCGADLENKTRSDERETSGTTHLKEQDRSVGGWSGGRGWVLHT